MSAKPIKVSIQSSTGLSMEQIHEMGAKRHGALWLATNQRVVDTARAHGLDVSIGPVKETLSEIALRILDGLRVDEGYHWDKAKRDWVKEPQGFAPGL